MEQSDLMSEIDFSEMQNLKRLINLDRSFESVSKSNRVGFRMPSR